MSKQEETVTRTRRRRAGNKTVKKEEQKKKQKIAKQEAAVKKKAKAKKKVEEKQKTKPVKEAKKVEEAKVKVVQEHRRYKGYDVQEVVQKHPEKEGNWFWKVMLTSLGISVVILLALVVAIVFFGKKQTDYISTINESNSLDSLLDGKTNLQITKTYAETLDGSDYTTVRQIREKEDGSYFSYYKTEGMLSDYKEVVTNNEVYRNDGNYTYYYAMVNDDYDKKLQELSGDVFSVYENEKIKSQTENSDTVTIITEYEVQAGDQYTQIYGYNAGEKIQREIIMDKATSQVMSDKETYREEVICTYTLELNVEKKTPNFYSKLKKKKAQRKCSVYFDYEGEQEKSYSYDIPEDVYFALFDHEGYTVYMDKEKEKEFTQYEMQMQNLDSVLTLYMVKNEEE